MALRISGRAITSDVTPETAHLVFGSGGGTWVLSWLPGWDLTREQAIDGMALDEILSDPSPADREFALEMAALRAESLGLRLEEVVVRLFARIAERDRQQQTGTDGADGPPGNAEGPCRTRRLETIRPGALRRHAEPAPGGERPTVRIVDSRRRAAHPMPGNCTPLGDFSLISPDGVSLSRCR
ncbi:hypothetical protein [Nocardia sp. NPDC051981]|uniref:hypothetical protein n=1 Tax=Nocardia sp. NPDC051981 TaxID=3155417 RepID=UPI003432EC95